MSDVAMSRAPRWKIALFFAFQGIAWLFEQVPVLIRRGEYRRLRDNDIMMDDAHRAIQENWKLRQKIEALTSHVSPPIENTGE